MLTLKFVSVEDGSDVENIVFFWNLIFLSAVNLKEDAADKGILATKQTEGISELLIISYLFAFRNVPKPISDLVFLIFSYEIVLDLLDLLGWLLLRLQ